MSIIVIVPEIGGLVLIYLDWAASAPMDSDILEGLASSMEADFVNPSAAHKKGKELFKRIEEARKFFLKTLAANLQDQFIFTSSATESNNTLIKGLGLCSQSVVSYFPGDHPSLVRPIERLARELNFTLNKFSPLDKDWAGSLDSQTTLVLLSHVNGQNGLLIDLKSTIEKIKAKAPSTHVHVDAVQSFTKYFIDVTSMQVDSLSLSSHKISGPKGVGGLYLKKDVGISPLLDGGGQEGGLRSSTLAAPLIFAFEKAAFNKLAREKESFIYAEKLKTLIKEQLGPFGIFEFPFEGAGYSPYICCFYMQELPSDVVMRFLEMQDIFVASSSACSSKVKGYNPVFEMLGIDKSFHKNVLRVSYGDGTSLHDVEVFCKKLIEIIEQLKGIKKR